MQEQQHVDQENVKMEQEQLMLYVIFIELVASQMERLVSLAKMHVQHIPVQSQLVLDILDQMEIAKEHQLRQDLVHQKYVILIA